VRASRALGPALLALAFVALAAWSWGRWADVQIDFGLELYTAWRLSEGAALYRDLAYRNGPLSPYLNALLFTLFGVSVRTLVVFNLAVVAGVCALLWRMLAPAAGRLAATVCGLVFLGVFAFSQYVDVGNYNWVTPYQHAQTHGVALALGMLAACAAQLARPRRLACALAGACLGGVFLTKAELFVPAAAAGAAGLAAMLAAEPAGSGRRLRLALGFAAGALLPVAVGAALLLAQMPRDVALNGLLGNWAYLDAGVAGDPFYAAVAGLDAPAANLRRALRVLMKLALAAACAYAADRALARARRPARWAVAGGLAVFCALLLAPAAPSWTQLGRALPFASALGCALLLPLAWSARGSRERFARRAPLALFAVLALGLLAKTPLRASIPHYGFALAMPATLLVTLAFVEGLPRLRRDGRTQGRVARGLALGAVAAGLVFHLAWSNGRYAHKSLPLGEGLDRLWFEEAAWDPRPQRVGRALGWLGERLAPGATLLVFPEGLGLNYWLRRVNPTRYGLFLPTELRAHGGEERVLAELRAHPPDWVALVDRASDEFGTRPFGEEPASGRAILRWIEQDYRRELRIGPEPFRGEGFGIVVLRRAR
jgi:hypothetical protein